MAKNKKGRRNKPACHSVKDKDRLTTLPNDVLLNILERLDTADAIRACTLCKRMTKLPAELSRIVVDANSFTPNKVEPDLLTLSDVVQMNGALAAATEKLLNFRSQQIALHQLSLRFYLRYYDCLTIGKAVQHAMSTYNLETVEFTILTEKQGECCEETHMLCFGKQFRTFLAAFPDAFAGLTRLQLQHLHFAEPDIPNLLTTCKQLKHLRLFSCLNQDDQAVLRIEHPQLVELDINYGDFDFVELKCLPKLRHMAYVHWDCHGDPLSFGDVPLLSSLSLTNTSAGWQKNLRLSQLLSTIWVRPECPKLLGPVFHKLQRVSLVDVPEGCNIDWTMFILEAAPSLKEICITVWDHWCNMKTEEDRREEGYCDKTVVDWVSSAPDGFRHENLSKVTIYGFQPDDNLVGFVRRVMEVAVNLEEVSLYDRKARAAYACWCSRSDQIRSVSGDGDLRPEAACMERVLKSARESGSLNLSNRSLREVPKEVYNNLDTGAQDEKWWEGVDLQKLILAHNNLEVLREDLRNLSSLVVLNISHNNISSLPAAIGDLPLLKSLDVSSNQINALPEEIGFATALVKVDCSNNRLTDLPVSLARCLELSELNASNNTISVLPDELAGCSKLFRLNLEGNKLVTLSDKMFMSWTMLTEMNADHRADSFFPWGICFENLACSMQVCYYLNELSKLWTLTYASACYIQGTMTTLRKLLLTGNPMRTLRSSLVSGPTTALLKYLRSRLSSDEGASGSGSTPTKDDQIAAARRLSLSSKELDLSGLGVTSVPPAAWETNDVMKLDLSKNSIEDLPNELSLCSSLQSLILSNNKIKRWPGTVFSSLASLSLLKLDNNPLAEILATDLEALSKLEVLDLSGSASSLPEPSAVSKLPHLKELYLRRMKLHGFPDSLLGLKLLRILDLSQNYLTSVPEGIKDLTSLIELDLSDNNITTLPPELGLLEPNLQVLKLDGNPLRRVIDVKCWYLNANGLTPSLVPGKDRLSDLPDDVLLNILERLDTSDAMKTCILSKNMRATLPDMLSRIAVDVAAFSRPNHRRLTLREVVRTNGAVADLTAAVLEFRRPEIPVHHLALRFYLRYYDCISIAGTVARAMAARKLAAGAAVEFSILTEKRCGDCTDDDLVYFAGQFHTLFTAYPAVFAGLTRLQLENLWFGDSDIAGILLTCKNLRFLRLFNCKSVRRSVLQVEHNHLVELEISHGNFETIELVHVPKLQTMKCQGWISYLDPLFFGYTPLLQSLSLVDTGMSWKNSIRLSHFLANAPSLHQLNLNFQSEKIWVEPEGWKRLAPVLGELRHVTLVDLPEGCDIA
uniref:F-box domain-containing protein n=1 Tax=Oryza meridionalis TaxID=40149 RepID=A0A0E0CTE6_9ORYZ